MATVTVPVCNDSLGFTVLAYASEWVAWQISLYWSFVSVYVVDIVFIIYAINIYLIAPIIDWSYFDNFRGFIQKTIGLSKIGILVLKLKLGNYSRDLN